MSVSFGFVSPISFAVTTVLLRAEKRKENSILKRSEHLACKKIENKLKKEKKRLKNVNGAIFLIG